MYERTGIGALPKWLTPPQSLKDLVKGIAGALIQGTTVTIPTPMGPQTFNVGSAEDLARLKAMVAGTRVNVATPQPGGTRTFPQIVEQSIPGGFGTLAIAGLAVVAFGIFAGMRRGRR